MVSKTFGVIFYLKKPKNYVKGAKHIYLRITIDGARTEISSKRVCEEPQKWNSHAGRMVGTKESVRALNSFLDSLQQKVFEAYQSLLHVDEIISPEKIKNKVLGITEKGRMLLEVFQQHNEQMNALVGQEYSILTARRYATTLQHTREFINWKFRLNDIEINKLNYEFISDYEFYLKSVRKCGHNSAIKYLSNFKKIVLQCVKKGWLPKDPFYGFNMATKEVIRDILTSEELERIRLKEFKTERLKVTRDIFLFSCYTGLAYVDIHSLSRSDIGIGVDGQKWIFSTRQKTETPFKIPLLPIPLEILNRYKDHPHCLNKGCLLPVWSNQKLNEYLKEIAELCGISKKLTYHMARHTFATTVTLNNGVPIETVSKMLGHQSIKITQRYAKILESKISEDMLELRQKLYIPG
jgi:site-specific recombinase XerD